MAVEPMNGGDSIDDMTPSQRIDNQIAELGDWWGEMLARLRALVLRAAPEIREEWKWGTAVWSQKGLVCSAAAFKDHVKLNFFKGASLEDPHGLFNAGLEARTMRSIDFSKGDAWDERALSDLVRAAVTLNQSGGKQK